MSHLMSSVFGAAPNNSTPVWHPEPITRGSFNILSTCVLTLIACLWTAVHLNVPKAPRDDALGNSNTAGILGQWFRKNRNLWRKCSWVVLGILAPEVVAYAAFVQHDEARKLFEDVNAALHPGLVRPPRFHWLRKVMCWQNQEKDGSDTEDTQPEQRGVIWEPPHGYYASMGGFAFEACKDASLPQKCRATITPSGTQFLATFAPQLIPQIRPEEIKDKSKEDGFAKFLRCAQIAWFCLHVVTRMSQGLPLSLLELNTSAHVMCALFIYTRWWNKPWNITYPSLAPAGEEALQMRCLLDLASSYHISPDVCSANRGSFQRPALHEGKICLSYRWGVQDGLSNAIGQTTLRPSPEGSRPTASRPPRRLPALGNCPFFPKSGFFGRYQPPQAQWDARQTARESVSRLSVGSQLNHLRLEAVPVNQCEEPDAAKRYIDLSPAEICAWTQASKALDRWVPVEQLNSAAFKRIISEPGVVGRVKNWPSRARGGAAQSCAEGVDSQIIFYAVASALYGGLHLWAWDAYFPDVAESWAWRISALSIASLGPALWLGNLMALVATCTTRKDSGQVLHVLCQGIGLMGRGFSTCFAIVSTLGRLYIVVACFMNLVHLSDSAFEVQEWAKSLPHAS